MRVTIRVRAKVRVRYTIDRWYLTVSKIVSFELGLWLGLGLGIPVMDGIRQCLKSSHLH